MSAEDRAGAGPPRESVRRSVILTTTANGLVPVLLLVSVYLTFRGHNAPGGGFAGGLVMATAVVLRYLADGPRSLDGARIDPVSLIGLGLLVAVLVAVAPLFVGGELLESAIWKVDVPVIGPVKVVSSAGFDIGVHILVLGAVLAVVTAFVRADETSVVPDTAPDHHDAGHAPAPEPEVDR
jgi:multisubunit Na+/H+ antiporter MnhB subunit